LPGWLLPALLFLGLVALLAWWVVPGSIQGNRAEKFDSLMAGAREDYSAALAVSDLSQKRQLLGEVSSQLAEAEDIRPGDGELTALEGKVAAALAEMDGVQELEGCPSPTWRRSSPATSRNGSSSEAGVLFARHSRGASCLCRSTARVARRRRSFARATSGGKGSAAQPDRLVADGTAAAC
jgi:hypothetical protein